MAGPWSKGMSKNHPTVPVGKKNIEGKKIRQQLTNPEVQFQAKLTKYSVEEYAAVFLQANNQQSLNTMQQ